MCIYVFLYLELWSSLFPLKGGASALPYADLLNLEWTLQLGLLLILPTFCFLAIEQGVGRAVWEICRTVLIGSPLFFMFHMGTKAHYVSSTLKARATHAHSQRRCGDAARPTHSPDARG